MPAASAAGGIRFRVLDGDLTAFARDLKQADPALRRMLTRDLKTAAEPAVVAIRGKAQAYGLHRAAAGVGVKFRVSQRGASVDIAVDRRVAPYAKALNGGSQGRRIVNRHPVYGNRNVWVNQRVRPFFTEGVIEGSPKVGQAMVDAMQSVAVAAGFRRT